MKAPDSEPAWLAKPKDGLRFPSSQITPSAAKNYTLKAKPRAPSGAKPLRPLRNQASMTPPSPLWSQASALRSSLESPFKAPSMSSDRDPLIGAPIQKMKKYLSTTTV
ncbi:hypothetical protein GUJ93_ZPchr0015g6980 [Zizania palustris]|uniref:Uncharacterized protein n=1 Tax=Zizania palustris TaxID=103762 RepID=A0A8J5TGB5_ZIZPA|nr:hypothetical protein GUJ93_ZPchr0015g6980 [Zizania palustris]